MATFVLINGEKINCIWSKIIEDRKYYASLPNREKWLKIEEAKIIR